MILLRRQYLCVLGKNRKYMQNLMGREAENMFFIWFSVLDFLLEFD